MAGKGKRIAAMPIPLPMARKIGQKFQKISIYIIKDQKEMSNKLNYADIHMKAHEYVGFALFTALFYGVLTSGLLSAASFRLTGSVGYFGIVLGLILALGSFGMVMMYPSVVLNRIARSTEKDMLSSMRYLMIQVRSGVPLFNAMAGLTEGYGQVSVEFERVIRDMNGGMSDVQALNNAVRRNQSLFFRKAMWQLINTLEAGSDIAVTMDEITKSFAKSEESEIRKYGQQLNPLTMMYMIMSVIFPSLGITFLIILTSFSGLNIPSLTLPGILVFLVIFQFFFIGFVKSRRPSISV